MNPDPFRVVIPARYASTRLPGKALISVAGRAMVLRVCDQAAASGAMEIIVATDDERIADVVSAAGYRPEMTAPHHRSGSERIAEVADRLAWPDGAIIVNLQGDEPLMPPGLLAQVAERLQRSSAEVATVAIPITTRDEFFNPHCVKAVLDDNGHALYFSRAPIPWHRDAFAQDAFGAIELGYRHLGLYAYRAGFLRQYVRWPIAPIETLESLEQLRILANGGTIAVAITDSVPEGGVDTPEDLQRVEGIFARCIKQAVES